MRPRLLALAAAVAAVSAVGCNLITSGGDRVVLSTSIEPTQFASGDTTLIVVTLNNLSLATATIEPVTCESFFEILDAQGNPVGPGVIDDCGTEEFPVTITSGQTFTLAGVWTGTTASSTAENPVYVAPGDYRVRGKVTVRELGAVTGRQVTIRVTE